LQRNKFLKKYEMQRSERIKKAYKKAKVVARLSWLIQAVSQLINLSEDCIFI